MAPTLMATLVGAVLALAAPVAGPARGQGPPGLDLGDGLRWQPHPRALAAALLVAEPRTDARLLRESLALLRDSGFSVLWLDAGAHDGPAALARVARAWAEVRLRHPVLPLGLIGHGHGAAVATMAADALEPAHRPGLLWLLAPGSSPPAGPASALGFPEAALARVDGLCNGRVERVTRVMLTHGAADVVADPQRTRAFADAAPAATLYRVPAAGHDDLLAATETRSRQQRLLSQWIHQSRAARAAWRGSVAPTR